MNIIEQWIDQVNLEYLEQQVCCSKFSREFKGFHRKSFLKNAHYVVVDEIPKPDFPELRQMGLGEFIDMKVAGITYKNTYYIKAAEVNNLRLHFHELVHVAQWQHLGTAGFIQRYINEIQRYNYRNAPLEIMAYDFDEHFIRGGKVVNVADYVSKTIIT